MTSKQSRYTETLDALASETIACCPESWSEARLTIECDGAAMRYWLKNPNSEDKAQISGELRQLCEDLYLVMHDAGDVWRAAELRLFLRDGEWAMEAGFTYDDEDAAPPAEQQPAVTASKPWWRFWQ